MDTSKASLTVGRCPIDGELVLYSAGLGDDVLTNEDPVCPSHQALLEDLGSDAARFLMAAEHVAEESWSLYLR